MVKKISNSFHASAKNHAVHNAAKLEAIERHNGRGYLSFAYDANKIHDLTGNIDSLATDAKDFINNTFNSVVDDYNAKQKRKDRIIKTSAFEHFENNKKLDVAVESIFQVGDRNFWSQYRTDEYLGKNKKGYDIVKHDFNDDIPKIMDKIYLKQAKALETIYDDKNDEIVAKLDVAYKEADDYLKKFETEQSKETKERFEKIFELKPKQRQIKISELTREDKILYSQFANAKNDWKMIKESRLIERTKEKQMHIKLINLTAHYDEYSPHAHGLFIMSADGYKTGLSSRVAKSIVLNKWSLEIIQDHMHEIAKEEMAKYPEVFNIELKDKEEGRLYHYETEQLMIKNMKDLEHENEKLKNENDNLMKENTELRISNRDLEEKNNNLVREVNETIEDNNHYKEINNNLKIENEKLNNEATKLRNDKDKLENEIEKIDNKLIEIKNDIDDIKEEVNKIDEFSNTQASNWISSFLDKIHKSIKIFREKNGKDPAVLSIPVKDLLSLETFLKPFVKLKEKVNALHNKLDEVIRSASKISSSKDVRNKNIDEKEIEETER